MVATVELSAGGPSAATDLATYAFYFLVSGVALQLASYARYGESEPERGEPLETFRKPARGRPKRVLIAVTLVLIILVIGSSAAYYVESSTSSISSSSGCAGDRSDGTVFVSTNVTVSIVICGQTYVVQAGPSGGLTYSFHSGTVPFIAPASVNGSQFEYWYAIVGSNPPTKVSNTTMTLTLQRGLNSKNTLIELFYVAPPTQVAPTKVDIKTTGSSTSYPSSKTSSIIATITNLTATSTTSMTVTSTVNSCRGSDGSFFVSTNISDMVTIEICDEQVSVPGGSGGGLNYHYHAGFLTLFAPATAGGKVF
jgi:hypothetical protein